MTGSPTIRVAIVGTGAIAEFHAKAYEALAPRYQLAAVCDADMARARSFAGLHGVEAVCGSLAEVIGIEDLELVDLCTPPFVHVEQAAEALAGGRHVLCEKPLAGSLRDMDRLAELERQAGRRLIPVFQYRFDPEVRNTLALRNAGLFGHHRISTIENFWFRDEAYFLAPGRGTWQHDLGGTLAGHAIHAHDILCRIVGMPTRVFARTAGLRAGIETEDLAAVTFAFDDGTFATSSATLASRLEQTRFCFAFENVTIEGVVDMTRWEQPSWRYVPVDPADKEKIADVVAAVDTKGEQFEAQFATIHDCLVNGDPAEVTLEDARRSVELLTAMYYSADHSTDVALPLDADPAYYDGWRADRQEAPGESWDG